MNWKDVDLCGATMLSRVAAEYEVIAPKVAYGGRFRIKVWERADGGFFAAPNVCLRISDGSPDWLGGSGRSEAEALGDLLRQFMDEIRKREISGADDFEWSDPRDF